MKPILLFLLTCAMWGQGKPQKEIPPAPACVCMDHYPCAGLPPGCSHYVNPKPAVSSADKELERSKKLHPEWYAPYPLHDGENASGKVTAVTNNDEPSYTICRSGKQDIANIIEYGEKSPVMLRMLGGDHDNSHGWSIEFADFDAAYNFAMTAHPECAVVANSPHPLHLIYDKRTKTYTATTK